MIDPSPAIIIAFIGGPAILANACAVLQSSATVRHNLSISQWREFNASTASHDQRLSNLYADPDLMILLARRRIRLQLQQTRYLLLAACLFAATSFVALFSAFAAEASLNSLASYSSFVMIGSGVSAVLLMLCATILFYRECNHAERMLSLHLLMPRSKPLS